MLGYIDFDYLIPAIFVFILFLILYISRKKFNFNIDEFIVSTFKKIIGKKKSNEQPIKTNNTNGNKTLILLDAGTNKATVTATLRQIMNIDLPTAQNMVEKAPTTILSNISEKDADINKAALEFVGAKLEIR